MSDQTYRKKLIEVALPLDAINEASAREKTIRHGHPSALHLWWARRPLAACRAVLFAQLVDDPSGRPEKFPTEEAQDAERERLFRIVEDLVPWENSTNLEILKTARAEILQSYGGDPPPILDPFAGGGAIPLEAQRLGLEARASDLNPVAVLINKALIEIPPRWAGSSPVHPDADIRTQWSGAEGLAEDVSRYGIWLQTEASTQLGGVYPEATLPDGSRTNVIAWIWARTVACPNPGCGAVMPLISSLWLSKRKGREVWVDPVVVDRTVRFELGRGPDGPPDVPKLGRGAKFRCLVCGEAAPPEHIKSEGMAGRIGKQLMAVAAVGNRQRHYLAPSEAPDRDPASGACEATEVAAVELSLNTRHTAPPLYGMTSQVDLYTPEQLFALTTFADLIPRAMDRIRRDAVSRMPEGSAEAYAADVTTYLAMVVAKLADLNSTLVTWKVDAECPVHVFSQQVYPMTWDFAEANPLSGASGSWESVLKNLVRGISSLQPDSAAIGRVDIGDARHVTSGADAIICTDPPYCDNVPYADLSDYFYPWLRRSLRSFRPELFGTIAAPKAAELVADPIRQGSKEAADQFFEDGFFETFGGYHPGTDTPLVLFYAFRQSEKKSGGEVSTGWATMLQGLLDAGWSVTGTWPMRTEGKSRLRSFDSNALASSIVISCRRRQSEARDTDRQGFIRSLRGQMPGRVHDLQKAHIAPVDLRQAAIGPGMSVFSDFKRVLEPDGSSMNVRMALSLINQVLDEVLDEQEQDFDLETRWAIQWFSQFTFDEGPYGIAEQLAVSMNVAVSGLVESGILASHGGRVRLLSRAELPDDWNPETDLRKPVWEATQHLVKRLESDGETSASRLLSRIGGLGESAQLLAYRLYTVCERTRPNMAGPYNALVASWPEIQRLALEAMDPTAEYEQLSLDG